MESEESKGRLPNRPEREGDALDDDAPQLSKDDLQGIAAIRRALDIEFGGAAVASPSPVPERAREVRASSRRRARRTSAALRVPRAAAARRAPRAAVAALMLLASAFVGIISAVVTYVILEWPEPTETSIRAPAAPPASGAQQPSTIEPHTVEPASPTHVPELPPRAATLSDLQDALSQWIEATRRRDIDGQMKLYPDRVDMYYERRNVSRAAVRSEKERVFAEATVFDITTGPAEITARPDGTTAVTRFRKRYVIEGPRLRRRGEFLQELRWIRTADGWKITAEREAKVRRK